MTVQTDAVLAHDSKQLHPLHHPAKHKNPLVIERASGVWIHTSDGQRILDGLAGLWNVNVGYGRTELADVCREQMAKLAFTSNFAGMTNIPASDLAEKMSGILHPSLKMTFFTSGGSESNDTAFKTARYYFKRVGKPEKTKIIARKLAYHGITMAATFATGIERYHKMFGPPIPGFLHVATPNTYRFEGDLKPGETIGQAAARALEEAILREGPETVAAFIAEPLQGVGGVLVPPSDYWPLIRAICDRHDVLLIVDEVITGFGRTGKLFGSHQWGIRPDILTFAKGITSGYMPLGGIQISDAIRDAILGAEEGETWMHGFTYSGHAASCAVALANLAIIEREGLVERSRVGGERLLAGLKTLLGFNCVGDVRGCGLVCGVEIVSDKAAKTSDAATAGKIYEAAIKEGLRTRAVGASTLAFAPPLCITDEEIDQLVSKLRAAITAVAS